MTKPVIRPALMSDVSAITAIYAGAVTGDTATFEMEAPSEAAMAARMEAIASAGHPFLVAEINTCVCGYAYASGFRPRAAFALTLEDSVYVAPNAQGRGLGKALLGALITEASAKGFHQMVAVIGSSRTMAASLALHAALGFEDRGRLDAVGRKHGQWLDIVFMQRSL